MTESEERFRRSGVRLAILALVVVGVYFLTIFAKQSWNLYRLTREREVQEQVVQELEQENARLRARLGRLLGEEGRRILVKENLPYRDPDEQVVIPIAGPSGGGSAVVAEAPEAIAPEDWGSLPVWQQWWRVIFQPAGP